MASASATLRAVACAAMLSGACMHAPAQEAQPLAADPALEARVMDIATGLRCLVCQNESLAGSQSALAIDLRRQISAQLSQGRSPEQVREYMVERYGAFVLYRPAFDPTTWLLWIGPFVLLAAGGATLWRVIARQRTEDDVAALPSDGPA